MLSEHLGTDTCSPGAGTSHCQNSFLGRSCQLQASWTFQSIFILQRDRHLSIPAGPHPDIICLHPGSASLTTSNPGGGGRRLLTFRWNTPAMHQRLVSRRSPSLIPQKPRQWENAPATASVQFCCIISREREKMPEIASFISPPDNSWSSIGWRPGTPAPHPIPIRWNGKTCYLTSFIKIHLLSQFGPVRSELLAAVSTPGLMERKGRQPGSVLFVA